MKYPKKTITLVACISLAFTAFNTLADKEDRLFAISKEYKSYKQHTDNEMVITDSTKYSWTLRLCKSPEPIDSISGFHYKTDSTFISKADATLSPHGNKLYKLYVKDYYAYHWGLHADQPIGQVIVKETWNVKEITYDSLNTKLPQVRSRNDGKWYTPTTVSEVFIMYKEQESESNDKGWNYGTVSLEDKSKKPMVLNDRKLSSCIGCHVNTKYDRIFGARKEK